MHRTQLFIPHDMHEDLIQESQSLGITISELVRQVMSQYLNVKHRKTMESGITILLDMAEGEDNESTKHIINKTI